MCDWKFHLQKYFRKLKDDEDEDEEEANEPLPEEMEPTNGNDTPPPLKISSFTSNDGLVFINSVKHYLRPKKLAEFRLVSKEFAMCLEDYDGMKENLVYHVSGKRYRKDGELCSVQESIKTLLNSKIRWPKIAFSDMDLEKSFFRGAGSIGGFREKQCVSSLKSLTFDNVVCGLGRLVEIVAFCNGLEELKIINCPNFFTVGMEIINWCNFLPHFLDRIKNLKELTIVDQRTTATVLTVNTVDGLLSYMKLLVKLNLHSMSGIRNMSQLMRIVEQNMSTLRHLSLVGKCLVESPTYKILSKLNLFTLCLGFVIFGNPSKDLGRFLRTQKNLEALQLINLKFAWESFEGIETLTCLKQLILDDCCMFEIRQRECCFGKIASLTDLRIYQHHVPVNAMYWTRLYDAHATYKLKLLHITLDKGFMINNFHNPCFSDLKYLQIVGMGLRLNDIYRTSVIYMLRQIVPLKTLEELDITYSDVDDQCFYHLQSVGANLSNLTSLKFLNLSFTHIGDEVLLDHIMFLVNLEELWVNGTQVTTQGIEIFVAERNYNSHLLKKFHTISALYCPNFKIPAELYNDFLTAMMGLTVQCDLI